MLSKDIGIDLGTANVLIFVKGKGIVLNEPSVIAVDKKSKKVVAIGQEAKTMLGRTPENIQAVKPMKDGVIADFELTEIMLNEFLTKIKVKKLFVKPRILICCPTNITPVEKNAIREAASQMGARSVYIEEEPKVAAIGAGLDISSPTASMVVDIGGGTCDIAVLSMNEIVTSKQIKIAGNHFNDDIIKYIREKNKLVIGELTAEDIKVNFTNVFDPVKSETMTVKGRNLVTGLPDKIELHQDQTRDALKDSMSRLIKSISLVLEDTPPELSADIVEKGIVLTGGGANLKGLVELLESKLKVPVLIAESPLTCVCEGCGKLLDDIKSLEKEKD